MGVAVLPVAKAGQTGNRHIADAKANVRIFVCEEYAILSSLLLKEFENLRAGLRVNLLLSAERI